MKYTKTIVLITTLLCFLQGQGLALAQDNPNQYNYLYLTIRNGLCDNSIRTIHKDRNSCGSEPPTGSTVTMVTN